MSNIYSYLRHSRSMSLKEFSNEIGISPVSISKLEHNRIRPFYWIKLRYLKYFGYDEIKKIILMYNLKNDELANELINIKLDSVEKEKIDNKDKEEQKEKSCDCNMCKCYQKNCKYFTMETEIRCDIFDELNECKLYPDNMKEETMMKVKEELKETGIKHDEGKLLYHLIPAECLEQLCKVYTFGAKKYGENNWIKLDNPTIRFSDALERHFIEFKKGNQFDNETGINHLAHVAWNAFALLWFDLKDKHEL